MGADSDNTEPPPGEGPVTVHVFRDAAHASGIVLPVMP
jgi:hypothetical protein